MTIQKINSFAAGEWITPGSGARSISSAITGEVIAEAGNDALDCSATITLAGSDNHLGRWF